MKNILLFGGPGAGKGTQAAKVIEKYGLIHLSTGNILRSAISEKTKLGKEASKFIEKGDLVPDEVVIGMIKEKIEAGSDSEGFVFDGFPRTIKQAEALDKLLNDKGTPVSLMLALDVEEKILIDRLLRRAELENRPDDNQKVIENRIKVYNLVTSIVADYFKKQDKYTSISGEGSIEEIFQRITKVIDKIL